MTHTPELPVFQLIGGTEEVRGKFTARLMAELDRQSLCATLLKCKDKTNQSTVASLVKQFDLVIVDGVVDFPMQKVEIGCGTEPANGNLGWSGGDDRQLRLFVEKLAKQLNRLVHQMEV